MKTTKTLHLHKLLFEPFYEGISVTHSIHMQLRWDFMGCS